MSGRSVVGQKMLFRNIKRRAGKCGSRQFAEKRLLLPPQIAISDRRSCRKCCYRTQCHRNGWFMPVITNRVLEIQTNGHGRVGGDVPVPVVAAIDDLVVIDLHVALIRAKLVPCQRIARGVYYFGVVERQIVNVASSLYRTPRLPGCYRRSVGSLRSNVLVSTAIDCGQEIIARRAGVRTCRRCVSVLSLIKWGTGSAVFQGQAYTL